MSHCLAVCLVAQLAWLGVIHAERRSESAVRAGIHLAPAGKVIAISLGRGHRLAAEIFDVWQWTPKAPRRFVFSPTFARLAHPDSDLHVHVWYSGSSRERAPPFRAV